MEAIATTSTIASNMRTLRQARGWSAHRLAEEMFKVGISWEHGVITKLETGRRQAVSVDELLALANVLEVEPMALARNQFVVRVSAEVVDGATHD
jgi:transcriptional regulator with XRE-family HTH domain